MSIPVAIVRTLWGLMCVALCISPLFHVDGSLWLLAALSSYVMYRGFSGKFVYGGFAVLCCTELFYGFQIGVLSIAFLLSTSMFMNLQRFISLRPWGQQDGWLLSDGIRALTASWVYTMLTVFMSVLVSTVLYRTGALGARLATFVDPLLFTTILVVCVVTLVIVRRMTIPFKRAILFGQ